MEIEEMNRANSVMENKAIILTLSNDEAYFTD